MENKNNKKRTKTDKIENLNYHIEGMMRDLCGIYYIPPKIKGKSKRK